MSNERTSTKIWLKTMAKAEKLGLTITDPNKFELAADTKVVLLNKSGTLTEPTRKVTGLRLAQDFPKTRKDEIWALAAALEAKQRHPIAIAIRKKVQRKAIALPKIVNLQVLPSQGVVGRLKSEEVFIGGPSLLVAKNIPIHEVDLLWSEEVNQAGNTVVYVVRNSELIGMIVLSESIFPEAADLVNKFHEHKIRVAMVTGDDTRVAEYVAKQLNIAEVFAEIRETQRADVVRKLKSDGSKVAFVGELDTDVLALAEAQVGIAINSAGATNSDAAGLHLRSAGMAEVLETILLSRWLKLARLKKLAMIFGPAFIAFIVFVILITPK